MKDKTKPIVILGMHRSGTSAISGVLAKMGVSMGKRLFLAQKGVNEKGFWENSKIVKINEQIFDVIVSSWDDPLSAFSLDMNSMEIKALKNKAKKIIENDYADEEYWGIKDPRVSITLPFWQSLFDDMKIDITYLLMVRHPLEVVKSLSKRDGFSQTKSLMLWLNYTLYSSQGIKNNVYLIVLYDELMSNAKKTILDVCDIYEPSLTNKVDKASSFISKDLRHHKSLPDSEIPESDTILTLSLKLYDILSKKTVNDKLISEIENQFSQYKSEINAVMIEQNLLIKKREILFRKLFYKAYKSYWWKFAWPFRKIEKLLKFLIE